MFCVHVVPDFGYEHMNTSPWSGASALHFARVLDEVIGSTGNKGVVSAIPSDWRGVSVCWPRSALNAEGGNPRWRCCLIWWYPCTELRYAWGVQRYHFLFPYWCSNNKPSTWSHISDTKIQGVESILILYFSNSWHSRWPHVTGGRSERCLFYSFMAVPLGFVKLLKIAYVLEQLPIIMRRMPSATCIQKVN